MIKAAPLPKWTERSFSFGYSSDFIPFLVERLSATSARIGEHFGNASEDALLYKPEGRWSVKEHIGHLADLELLHEGRLDDFGQQLPILRAADMSNRRTEEADHNAEEVGVLWIHFHVARKGFFDKLEVLSEAALQHRALHPRLQQEINIADMLYFMAEHDTHHLAHMSRLLAHGV